MLQTLQAALASLTLVLSALQAQAAELPKLSPLEQWVEDLAMCESGDNPNALNPKDPITRSVGWLQFKDATFLREARLQSFYPKETTDKEILSHIWEQHTQKVMAIGMITRNYENWRAWTNCVLKGGVGKPPKTEN